MSIEVLAPGTLTSVQDLGRPGHRHLGVALGGALDPDALAIANALVGNAPGAAGLEITLTGPRLHFHASTLIALCGAACDAVVDGMPVPMWRRVAIARGATMIISRLPGGARAWLAIAGGLDVPLLLGSRSTDLTAGFGGWRGRALASGDRLPLGQAASRASAWLSRVPAGAPIFAERWQVRDLQAWDQGLPVRILPIDAGSCEKLCASEWRISPQSGRMGLRLEGPALAIGSAGQRISAGVAPGLVQCPPDGGPIVLLRDAQTVGGYPQVGVVASIDLPRLARLRPGARIRFEAIGLGRAHALIAERQRRLQRLLSALAHRG
jgi:antagonist of KipI